MSKFAFVILSLIWLVVMAGMAAIGPIGKHALLFAVLFCLGHVLMILLVIQFPAEIKAKNAFVGIIVLGIIARLFFLPYPVGNDIFRYVWEGYIQTQGYNPYSHAPDSAILVDVARGNLLPIWQQINHPGLSAAYPPVSQLVFRLLAWLDPNPLFYKIVMIAFDIGTMIALILMTRQRNLAPSRLMLYTANPLVLLYIAGEGHLDIIMIFLLCLAMYLILFKKSHVIGFLTLGLAILSKYFALIVFPFLVNAENKKKCLTVFIPLLLYIPYLDAGSSIFQSLGEFAANFHYNDSIAALTRYFFNDLFLFANIFLLMICLSWVYFFVHDQLRSIYLALGCLLLFLPTLHPWYLLLMTPFLLFFPSQAWLYLQAAVVFTFPVIAIEYNTGVFKEIYWLKLFEYIPFYGLLLLGLFKDTFLLRDRSYAKPKSFSAIIPTLNEADSLSRCLKALKNRTALKEVIVADGGSTDNTEEIAQERGARVVVSPKGRGLQIEKGIEIASGDVIIIMHADCFAKRGIFKRVLKILKSHPYAVGGAVGMRFEQKNSKTRLIELLNNLRTFLTGIAFGDQAQFFRAEVVEAMAGFPSMMLMEDVELSLRLKEIGRLVFLRDGILVSGRRWQANHFALNLMTVFRLFPRYLLERRFQKTSSLNRKYYRIYYGRR